VDQLLAAPGLSRVSREPDHRLVPASSIRSTSHQEGKALSGI
jgi:hypothetical protein